MIYTLQTLSLKVRFVSVLLLGFPVLVFHWLLTAAPWSLARLQILAPGTGVPDQQFWYEPSTLVALVDRWGEAGRAQYLGVLWPTDLGYLLAYGVFFTATMLYLLKKANPRHQFWYLGALLPGLVAAFDLLENLAIGIVTLWPLDTGLVVGWAAGALTSAKWVTGALGLTVLVLGALVHLGRAGWARYRRAFPRYDRTDPPQPGLN